MPFIMDGGENTLEVLDNISNSELKVKYRTPTTEERTAFSNESIQRKRNKVFFRTAEARLKFGLKVLTGIREGDFMIKKDGELTPLASDKKSPHYDPEWKQLMKIHASHIVSLLGAHVFEEPAETLEDDGEAESEDEKEPAGEDIEGP